MPDAKAVEAMMTYNETLQKAGVLARAGGDCTRRRWAPAYPFAGGKPIATDGPFAETKEVLGGYWMIQVNSRDEAIEWAKRCPAASNEVIEIRQVQEMEDFPADVEKAAAGFSEMQGWSRIAQRSLTERRAKEPMTWRRARSSSTCR